MADNLIPYENKASIENDAHFIFFKLGDAKYAINASHTIEVLKLPMLEYPQKLPTHIIGILNYNNLTINVVDLRSILDLEQQKISINSQLVIVKTEEAIFGILVDEVIDVGVISSSDFQHTPYSSPFSAINMIYHKDDEMVSVVDVYTIEEKLKEAEFKEKYIDYQALLPSDEKSKSILKSRQKKLSLKSANSMVSEFYYHDQFILFHLSKNIYCINIRFVKELVSAANLKITKLPCTPDFISGIINLRGDFVTIIDLKEFLNIEDNNNTKPEKILVFDNNDYKLAILVDQIIGIKSINNDKFIHKSNNKFDAKYTMAEIIEDEKIYNILNVEKIVNDERLFINIES